MILKIKAKIKDCALLSLKLYNEKGAVSSLNKDERLALKTLSNWLYKSQIKVIQ